MTQLAGEAQAQGESLDRWLGRPGVDLGVLLNNLRQHGSVRLFSTALRDEFGAESDVEISAGAVMNGDSPCYGFAIRSISRRIAPQQVAGPQRVFPKSLEQIIELIGRVSLKDLVREATDVIERLSIEAALTMTGDNRASAAEVLGVSRQSLYVKMRRHGLLEAEAISLE
jgi:transcriptional regulator PpsR